MSLNTVNIQGADEIDAVLKLLPEEIARKVLNNALLAGARVTAAEMRSRCPVDAEVRTGAKHPPGYGKKQIRARLARPSEYGKIAQQMGNNKFAAAAVAGPGKRAFYLRFIEWGWMLTIRKKRIRFIGPRPFLRPSWDSTRSAALDAIGKKSAEGIEKAAHKLAGQYRTSGLSKRGRTFIKL